VKAIIYARVSTAKNKCRQCGKGWLSADQVPACPQCGSGDIEKSQDTENQLLALRAFAVQEKHELRCEYVDRATGKNDEREQFRRMLEEIGKGKWKRHILLFWSLDRLSREGVLPTLQYLNTMTANQVEWKSFTEQYLDSTGVFKDAIIAILAALAKQQRIRISENTVAGLARAAITGTKSGKPIGRPKREFDVEGARKLVAETSFYAAAKKLKMPITTLRVRLLGRVAKKSKVKPAVWSEPVWGEISGEGVFQETANGQVVIRYEMGSGKPWCINHQVQLEECWGQHQGNRNGGSR